MLSAMSSSLHCTVKPKLNLGYVLEKNEVKDKTQMRTKPPCDYPPNLRIKMEFEIKGGVPLPRSRGRKRKYDLDLDLLGVGQMVSIPIEKNLKKEAVIIRTFVWRYIKNNPDKKFSVRVLQEEKSVGVWRTK